MPSGWTRWILEQFEFPFEVVYPAALDAGNLSSKYDVIIFPSASDPAAPGGGGARRRRWRRRRRRPRRRRRRNIPAEYQAHARRLHGGADRSAAAQVPRGRRHDPRVGRSSMNLAQLMQLPVGSHLAEKLADGTSGRCRRRSSTCPARCCGSPSTPRADRARRHQPGRRVLRQQPGVQAGARRGAEGRAAGRVVRQRHAAAQRLGLGPGLPAGRRADRRGQVGNGKLYLFGPEITFRAQPHGTFKFLFNGIYLGARKPAVATYRRPR